MLMSFQSKRAYALVCVCTLDWAYYLSFDSRWVTISVGLLTLYRGEGQALVMANAEQVMAWDPEWGLLMFFWDMSQCMSNGWTYAGVGCMDDVDDMLGSLDGYIVIG